MSDLSTMQDTYRLEFRGVSFGFDETMLFEELSFAVSPGQVLWVLGDNGVGKTSILRLAAGLIQPNEGEILWSQNRKSSRANRVIGFLAHGDGLNPLMSAYEELEFWSDIYDFNGDLNGIFRTIGLNDHTSIKTSGLSAGQKRRLALGRLILSGRPVWLLDEPKAAMDASGQALIETAMAQHVLNGGAVIAATHNQARTIGRGARKLTIGGPA